MHISKITPAAPPSNCLSVSRAVDLPTSIVGFGYVVKQEGKARDKEHLFAVSLENHRVASRQDGRGKRRRASWYRTEQTDLLTHNTIDVRIPRIDTELESHSAFS